MNDTRRCCAVALPMLVGTLLSGSARANPDVVHLKAGGRVQGVVLEEDPAAGVALRTVDGAVRHVPREEIASVAYGAAPARLSPAAAAYSGGPTPIFQVAMAPVPGDRSGTASSADGAPPGYHYESRSLKALWITGAVVDLSVWAVRAGVTLGICSSYSGNQHGCGGTDYAGAAIPVVGAWVQASSGVGGSHGASPEEFATLIGSGLVEGSAFILFVTGLAVHRRVLTATDGAAAPRESFHVWPTFGSRSVGIIGTF